MQLFLQRINRMNSYSLVLFFSNFGARSMELYTQEFHISQEVIYLSKNHKPIQNLWEILSILLFSHLFSPLYFLVWYRDAWHPVRVYMKLPKEAAWWYVWRFRTLGSQIFWWMRVNSWIKVQWSCRLSSQRYRYNVIWQCWDVPNASKYQSSWWSYSKYFQNIPYHLFWKHRGWLSSLNTLQQRFLNHPTWEHCKR